MLKKSYYIFSLLFLLQFPCIANDNSTTTKITVKKNYHTYTFLDENENVIFTRKLKKLLRKLKVFSNNILGNTLMIKCLPL